MKITHLGFLLVAFIFFTSCGKESISENTRVAAYIEALRADNYDDRDLPNFTSVDIIDLLEFIDDESRVTKFPRNMLSSYSPVDPEYKLGVLVVWTIEAIRVESVNPGSTYGFPSLLPFVANKDTDGRWIENHDDPAYQAVKDAYKVWWKSGDMLEFSEIHDIDPLLDTSFRWH